MNKPVAWMNKTEDETVFIENTGNTKVIGGNPIPLYTHPVINNGGNLEELNTKVQDASTSLESTPPINAEPVGRYYWESVVDGHFMAVPSEGTIHYEIDDFPLYLHPVKELTEWIGAEEWEQLAWELCADEHGEESCTDLIWDMGVIPEPWGDRWQKYEDEAKRMIAMVRKCTHPVKELTDDVAKYHYNKGHEDGRKLATVKELTNEEYAGIGLHLFRIGEATSIKEGIRLVKLVVELTNIRRLQEK